MQRIQIVLTMLLIAGLAACAPSNRNTADGETPDVSITPSVDSFPITESIRTEATSKPTIVATQLTRSTVSPHLPTGMPEIVVNPYESNQVIQVQVGQVLRVEMPEPDFEWQVDYDPDRLELLTPLEEVRNPGPEGWSFRTVSTGQGQIVLTSIVSCSEPPCPLMPMQLQLVVQIN